MAETHDRAMRFLNMRLAGPLLALVGDALEVVRDGGNADDVFDLSLAGAQLGKSCYTLAKDASADVRTELFRLLPDMYVALKEHPSDGA